MIHLNLLLISLLVSFPFKNSAIKCYAGSRGYIKGQQEQNFVNESCDDGMEYCIESFSASFDSVTASCQTLSTSRRILNLCESGTPEVNKHGLTTRCCSDDLCNNFGIEKKKGADVKN